MAYEQQDYPADVWQEMEGNRHARDIYPNDELLECAFFRGWMDHIQGNPTPSNFNQYGADESDAYLLGRNWHLFYPDR